MQEPRETVVFHLLDKVVAVELVATTIQTSVQLYVDRHGLDLDKTLLQYIEVRECSVPGYLQLRFLSIISSLLSAVPGAGSSLWHLPL